MTMADRCGELGQQARRSYSELAVDALHMPHTPCCSSGETTVHARGRFWRDEAGPVDFECVTPAALRGETARDQGSGQSTRGTCRLT